MAGGHSGGMGGCATAALAAIGVAVLCFTTVYPAIAPLMPFNDTTVGEAP